MTVFRGILTLAILAMGGMLCRAESAPPGKYSGVVVFDRWGGCMLYRGLGVLYISETIKEQLRDEAGKCIEADVTDIGQPNGGDPLIKALKVLGPASADGPLDSLKGLKLSTTAELKEGESPGFVIRLENTSRRPAFVYLSWLAPTVLTKRGPDPLGQSSADGPSTALCRGMPFWTGDEPRLDSSGVSGGLAWSWKVTDPATLAPSVTLHAKQKLTIHIQFELPPGEYEFLAGYGTSYLTDCLTTVPIAFDVKDDRTAMLVPVPGRLPKDVRPK